MGFRNGLGAGILDGVDEDSGPEDTVDITGVIAEEDTTKGREGADQVGLPGNWGLDALDILSTRQAVDVSGLRHARLLLVGGVRHFAPLAVTPKKLTGIGVSPSS